VQAISPLIKGMAKIAPRDYVRVQNRPADANGHGKAAGVTEDEPPPPSDWDAPHEATEDAPF
jgi:hypothetical protein